MDDVDPRLNELAKLVIGAAVEVHRALGPGFQEVTYSRALAIQLEEMGIRYQTEVPVALTFKGRPIGEGRIDILVEGCLVLELKATAMNKKAYRRQVIAYLKAGDFKLGLIINFEVERLTDGVTRVVNTKPN